MTDQPTVILISGASRGLGLLLLQRFLLKPNHTVIAANRDPSSSKEALLALPRGENSTLITVKLDAAVDADGGAAVEELRGVHGIEHLDIVLANAGVSFAWPPVKEVRLDEMRAHFEVNVCGVVALYQATRPLLQRSKRRDPIFAPMGSQAGLLAGQPPIPNACYGTSKAALNWLTIRVAAEDGDWLDAFVMDPGWVDTELGLAGARKLGAVDMLDDAGRACDGLVKVIEGSTRGRHGGKMVRCDGTVVEW